MQIAKQFLNNMFGEEVAVEYHDAETPETRTQYADLAQAVEANKYAYPLVLVNGELKASGGVDTYQLMFLVDQDRRAKGLPGRKN